MQFREEQFDSSVTRP
nr:unnamed protein product [Callosobruchus chinensis]